MKETAQAKAAALPALVTCRRARRSRDARFDGRFFVGVLTTGIYCRPTCPAKLPAEENVRYFASAAAAQDAGFRPCRRCRPEAAMPLPEWTLSSATVLRALRWVEAGYLNEHTCSELAHTLSLSERHLTRLFREQLGSTPKRIAQLSRVRLAKRLLASTRMRHADIAFHAGYRSLSRFNSEIRQIFQCTPKQLRTASVEPTPTVTMALPVRVPYHFDWVFGFLQKRALAGIECVDLLPSGWRYSRRVHHTGATVVVEAREDHLIAQLPLTDEPLHSLLRRVRRVFDLDADGYAVGEDLAKDPHLSQWVKAAPGLRVVGAWDGFELAVRAILGQQVSVDRATDLALRLVDAYGDEVFPAPEQLVDQDIASLGMPGKRAAAIRTLAEQALAGSLSIDECQDPGALRSELLEIPGVGPWTANYIAMRALKDPDAFPDNDWVVMKELGCTAKQARERALAWRPWRAYALMYLWYAAGQRAAKTIGRE